MKKISILIGLLIFWGDIVMAQPLKVSADSTKKNVLLQESNIVYKLFPTKNMWNFIKLNTRNGLMWQVQFNTSEKHRFQTSLNTQPLVEEKEEVNGRFTLYPTDNIFTHILLDQFDGKIWQVQWSTNSEDRYVIPIKSEFDDLQKWNDSLQNLLQKYGD